MPMPMPDMVNEETKMKLDIPSGILKIYVKRSFFNAFFRSYMFLKRFIFHFSVLLDYV